VHGEVRCLVGRTSLKAVEGRSKWKSLRGTQLKLNSHGMLLQQTVAREKQGNDDSKSDKKSAVTRFHAAVIYRSVCLYGSATSQHESAVLYRHRLFFKSDLLSAIKWANTLVTIYTTRPKLSIYASVMSSGYTTFQNIIAMLIFSPKKH